MNNVTNQGSGSMTLGAASAVNVANFQSYGILTLNPAAVGSNLSTTMTNVGSSSMYFNGGSQTFIGTPATATSGGLPTFVAGIILQGQNIVVAGGLFVNNGYVSDFSSGTHGQIIVDYGALYKGAGFTGVNVVTQNGGRIQAGNSPGSASFGNLVFGPGGVNNYVFAIDDATGTAGPTPDALGHVVGWGLISAIQHAMGSTTTSGDFTWTATPNFPLTIALDTLVNPTTVGTDVPGQMADFDPSQSYVWPAVRGRHVFRPHQRSDAGRGHNLRHQRVPEPGHGHVRLESQYRRSNPVAHLYTVGGPGAGNAGSSRFGRGRRLALAAADTLTSRASVEPSGRRIGESNTPA